MDENKDVPWILVEGEEDGLERDLEELGGGNERITV